LKNVENINKTHDKHSHRCGAKSLVVSVDEEVCDISIFQSLIYYLLYLINYISNIGK